MVEVVEVRRFIESRFNEVALEVQVIISVLLNDISDGVALFKAVEGSLYDYVRKSREYNILILHDIFNIPHQTYTREPCKTPIFLLGEFFGQFFCPVRRTAFAG